MKKLPKIEKSIKNFLTTEDGKITKEALVKTGKLLMIAATATILQTTANAATPAECLKDLNNGYCKDIQGAPEHSNTISVTVTNPNLLQLEASHSNTFTAGSHTNEGHHGNN